MDKGFLEDCLAKGMSLEALVGEGLTLREMADQLDRSATTVRYWMGKVQAKDDPPQALKERESPFEDQDVVPAPRSNRFCA